MCSHSRGGCPLLMLPNNIRWTTSSMTCSNKCLRARWLDSTVTSIYFVYHMMPDRYLFHWKLRGFHVHMSISPNPLGLKLFASPRQALLQSKSWWRGSADWTIPWCRSLVQNFVNLSLKKWFKDVQRLVGQVFHCRHFSKELVLSCLVTSFAANPRKAILDLHERFLCGGGWGLERTLNKWACKQPWRQILPLSFFETLSW